MYRGALVAAIAALCAPALLSCSGDPSPPDPTTPSPSTTTTTTATSRPPTTPPTTTATTPVASTPPPLAERESLAGSRAFVRFYIAAINASWHARSGSVPRRFSTRNCVSCRGLALSMDKIRHDDGFYRGGDWIVTSTVSIPLQSRVRPIVHTAVTVRPGVWKRSPTDRLRRIEADKMYVDVHLVWSDTTWLVTSMVPA
jgi:hypothetical protein